MILRKIRLWLKTCCRLGFNCRPPELAKYRTVHYKTHIWELGYILYLLGGLKFAFQRLPEDQVEKTSLNFHKVLPKSKFERVYPEELTSLVTAMLMKHPDSRPNWGRLSINSR